MFSLSKLSLCVSLLFLSFALLITIYLFLCFSVSLKICTHCMDSGVTDFRKLTCLLIMHVRSCSCIPPTSASMTGFFALPHYHSFFTFHFCLYPFSLAFNSVFLILFKILLFSSRLCLCLVPVFPLTPPP